MDGPQSLASSKDNVVTEGSQPPRSNENNQEAEDGDLSEKDTTMKNGQKSRAVYSRNNLMSLRESPVAKRWPSFLADEYVRNGVWDPEVWHQSSESAKRCASPVEDIKRQIIMEDGIVLSPQRQSFGQGCQIPQTAPERGSQQDRIKSMITRTDVRERDGRSRLTGRVGRGRTLDYKERTPLRERNKEAGDPRRMGPREREKGEREDWHKKKGRNDEPEWMTFGPSSQFDTIELKGFEREGAAKKTGSEKRVSPSDEVKNILSVGKSKPVNGEVASDSHGPKSKLSQESAVESTRNKKESNESKPEEKVEECREEKDKPFDINQFFMTDTSFLPFTGGFDQSSSRFCQFFGPGQPGSNHSSSGSRRSSIAEELMERSGFSSGGPSTPRSPSPFQPYGFTPIIPAVEANSEVESLADMLKRSKIDVKPLLDQVMSAGKDGSKVKGPIRLEDIEAEVRKGKQKDEVEQNKENLKKAVAEESNQEKAEMQAFQMLVQKMKTSGTLPEKSYPPITGLPSHLLPRPPSPKGKSPRHSPSPLEKLLRRSPSPTDILQHVIMQGQLSAGQLPSPKTLSPAQVVPQMDAPNSPLDVSRKSLVKSPQDLFSSPVLQRSSSPLSMLPRQQRGSPLNFNLMSPQSVPPQSRIIHKPVPQPALFNGEPQRRVPDKRQSSNISETPKTATPNKPTHTIDRGFMPTSVLRKYGRVDKTPKESGERKESKEKSAGVSTSNDETKEKEDLSTKLDYTQGGMCETPGTPQEHLLNNHIKQRGDLDMPRSREGAVEGPMSPRASLLGAPPLNGPTSSNFLGSPVLQKPTAFKPYPASPHLPPGVKSGSHSEPQSPLYTMAQTTSPLRHAKPVPHSAPVTPQRHPLAEKAALLPQSSVMPLLHAPGQDNASVANAPGSSIRASHNEALRAAIERHSVDLPEYQTRPGHSETRVPQSNGVHSVPSPERVAMQNHVEGVQMDQHLRHNIGLPRNAPPYVMPRGPGEPRPSPAGFARARLDSFGQRPVPNISSGRMSPMMHALASRFPRTPFNSPMSGVPMHPRSAVLPSAMMHQRVHPGFLRGLSPAVHQAAPGVNPAQHGMSMFPPRGQYPMMPGHHPSMYGGHVPVYPPMNPAAMSASPHMAMGASPRHLHTKRVSSPVSVPPYPHSSGNILSQWFSEDMLKQAGPQTSVTPDVARRVMSVEELERQQATVRN